jgi:hypothetical protein
MYFREEYLWKARIQKWLDLEAYVSLRDFYVPLEVCVPQSADFCSAQCQQL